MRCLSTTLDAAAVEKIVRSRYLQGIARCHERQLKTDRMTVGQVKLRFTVGPTGGVTKAVVKGMAAPLDACIESLAVKWRFGAPKDADGYPTSADMEADLLLNAK